MRARFYESKERAAFRSSKMANEGGSFVHNLRPERRVYRQFDGNKWKAEELAQAITEAAQSGHP